MRSWRISSHAESDSHSTPLTQALRPGESYTADLVFEVPDDACGVRLLISEDDSETRLVIGHAFMLCGLLEEMT
jgi:hypothetical protein